jgi:peptidoglycan/LPS O-acetylase OafA/YrhL
LETQEHQKQRKDFYLRREMKRVPILDFIRFISIFVVIGGHFYPRWIADYGYPPIIQNIILGIFLNGAYGVTFFFVVSGFLITRMLAESLEDFSKIDLKAFYAKRAARIFPLLLLVVLTGFCMEHLKPFLNEKMQHYNTGFYGSSFGWGFWLSLLTFNFDLYLTVKGLQHGVGLQWIILWSLAIEERFYLFYPIVMKLLKKRHRIFWFLGSVTLADVLFRFLLNANSKWMHGAPYFAFHQIAIGGILYFSWERLKTGLECRPKICFLLLLLGSLMCFALYFGTSISNKNEALIVPTLLAIGCALVILGGINLPAFNSTWASLLSWPGKLSYGCYLWHPTLIFVFLPFLAQKGGMRALGLLLVFVWIFAFISYRYFEVPMNYRIRSFFNLKPSKTL